MLQKLAQKIEELRKEKVSDAKIAEILELDADPDEILRVAAEYENVRTVEEAAEMLRQGITNSKETFNYAKVIRLIKEKKLATYGEKTSNKAGHRLHVKEIERFIEEANMTSDDWKKRVDDQQKTIEKLQKQLEQSKKRETNLKAKVKKLEEAAAKA